MSCRDHVRRPTSVTSRFGGTAYDALDRMLDAAQPDCVYVAVPPHRAVEIGQRLAARRFPFLTEKPLAADDPDGPQRLAAEIERARLVVAVGYHLRALDIMPGSANGSPPPRRRWSWPDGSTRTPPPAWWGRAADGGGQVIEQATHLYDLARWLMGEATVIGAASTRDPGSSPSGVDVVDSTAAVLQFERGGVGSFANTRRVASAGHRDGVRLGPSPDDADQATRSRPGRLARDVRQRDRHPRHPRRARPVRDPGRGVPRRCQGRRPSARAVDLRRRAADRSAHACRRGGDWRPAAVSGRRLSAARNPASAASTSSSRFPNGSRT